MRLFKNSGNQDEALPEAPPPYSISDEREYLDEVSANLKEQLRVQLEINAVLNGNSDSLLFASDILPSQSSFTFSRKPSSVSYPNPAVAVRARSLASTSQQSPTKKAQNEASKNEKFSLMESIYDIFDIKFKDKLPDESSQCIDEYRKEKTKIEELKKQLTLPDWSIIPDISPERVELSELKQKTKDKEMLFSCIIDMKDRLKFLTNNGEIVVKNDKKSFDKKISNQLFSLQYDLKALDRDIRVYQCYKDELEKLATQTIWPLTEKWEQKNNAEEQLKLLSAQFYTTIVQGVAMEELNQEFSFRKAATPPAPQSLLKQLGLE